MNVFATGWSDGLDGPGRRWVIHLKGCSFRCRWCANPEGFKAEPDLLFTPARGADPVSACPHGAVTRNDNGCRLDRNVCAICVDRACVTRYRHPAFQWIGQTMTVDAIVARAERCRPFFGVAGGVTFSGGEPTDQIEACLEGIAALHARGIHTAVESHAGTPAFVRLFRRVDCLICDLKCVDPNRHRTWTGSDNAPILNNICRAVVEQPDMRIRITLVPGFNDDAEEQTRLAAFLKPLALRRAGLIVEVLRFHQMGAAKRRDLGLPYSMADVEPPAVELADAFVDRLNAIGLAAQRVS